MADQIAKWQAKWYPVNLQQTCHTFPQLMLLLAVHLRHGVHMLSRDSRQASGTLQNDLMSAST
jgi:hypothetical protein